MGRRLVVACLLAAPALVPQRSRAQTLGGRVLDDSVRHPVPFAQVRLRRVGGGLTLVSHARADSTGVFYANVPLAGVYEVTFRSPGGVWSPVVEAELPRDELVQAEFVIHVAPAPPEPPGALVSELDVDEPARVLERQFSPQYPPDALARSLEASLAASFIVDTLGHPEPESVRFTGTTLPPFEDAVRSYLGRARYRPAQRAGRPVRMRVTQSFNFKLKSGPTISDPSPFDQPRWPAGAVPSSRRVP